MIIIPAIDVFDGKAVRLYKGDYSKMTVYNDDPIKVAMDMKASGAEWLHIVDLEGAKSGETPNIDVISDIKNKSGMYCEVGGGIRSLETVKKYMDAGFDRIILGTAAAADRELLERVLELYGNKVAVGVDIFNGNVAVQGWTKDSGLPFENFCDDILRLGVSTIISTDISKDGAMSGVNLEIYRTLSKKNGINIIASGGVSSIDDIYELNKLGIYGTIIGKAYYSGAVSLKEAIEAAK